MNPSQTVIVIRSLVPGGVAQQDGNLVPGDRLMFVNDTHLGMPFPDPPLSIQYLNIKFNSFYR